MDREPDRPDHDPNDRLCRVTEVARQLAIGRSKVYDLMEAGELPYVKLGRSRRVPQSAVLALIRARMVGG